MDLDIKFLIHIWLGLLLLTSCQAAPIEEIPPQLTPGEITENQDIYGPYYLYTPTSPSDTPQSLIVIHSTPAKDLSAGETAFYYAEHRAPFAEEQGWLLLVPAFNQADFSSRKCEITDALTSYRGLFGREIGADTWVLRLLGLGQDGKVRLAIVQNWVEAMGKFAAENGFESAIQFEAIPGKGHSMLGLMPISQAALHPE